MILNMAFDLAQTNNSRCGAGDNVATIIMASAGGSSALICLLAVVLVSISGLYKQFVYRLALYQVSSSLAFGLTCVLQLLYVYYNDDLQVYRHVCVFAAWCTQFTCCLKLLFSAWMTVYLFLYATCYRNMRKPEVGFVAGVVFLSLLISTVPFATHSYGPSGSWCWIENLGGRNCSIQLAGVIEQFALWYGLAISVLLAQCAAIVAMIAVVTARVYRARRYQLLSNSLGSMRQYHNLLKQLLPLASYPILFTLLVAPPFVNRVYEAFHPSGNLGLLIANASFAPAWSLSAGITLMVHVCVVMCCTGKLSSTSRPSSAVEREGSITVHVATSCNTTGNSGTYFIIPSES